MQEFTNGDRVGHKYGDARGVFIGVNPDTTSSTPALIYEVDLGLTTVLNTYTGPSIVGIIEEDLNKESNSLDEEIQLLEGVLQ